MKKRWRLVRLKYHMETLQFPLTAGTEHITLCLHHTSYLTCKRAFALNTRWQYSFRCGDMSGHWYLPLSIVCWCLAVQINLLIPSITWLLESSSFSLGFLLRKITVEGNREWAKAFQSNSSQLVFAHKGEPHRFHTSKWVFHVLGSPTECMKTVVQSILQLHTELFKVL